MTDKGLSARQSELKDFLDGSPLAEDVISLRPSLSCGLGQVFQDRSLK